MSHGKVPGCLRPFPERCSSNCNLKFVNLFYLSVGGTNELPVFRGARWGEWWYWHHDHGSPHWKTLNLDVCWVYFSDLCKMSIRIPLPMMAIVGYAQWLGNCDRIVLSEVLHINRAMDDKGPLSTTTWWCFISYWQSHKQRFGMILQFMQIKIGVIPVHFRSPLCTVSVSFQTIRQ